MVERSTDPQGKDDLLGRDDEKLRWQIPPRARVTNDPRSRVDYRDPDLSVLLLCAENGERLVRVHDGALGFRATLLLLIVPDGKRMTTF
jgi:hypothetical protein